MFAYPEIIESKVKEPIIDVHIHLDQMLLVPTHLKQAKKFNVCQFVGLTPWDREINQMDAYATSYPDTFRFSFYTPSRIIHFPDKFEKTFVKILDGFSPHEFFPAVKFWCGSSRFTSNPSFKMDSSAHQRLYEQLTLRNLVLMVHIADPDSWYPSLKVKNKQLQQFQNVVAKNPELTIVGVHMGGNPERLSELSKLLDSYPNLFLDTSATKWVTRELSRQKDDARMFFDTYADRLLYGSDLVNSTRSNDYYFTRYWTHRVLFETQLTVDLPFYDPDSPVQPAKINGLDLSRSILEKLYFKNARRIFGFKE